MKAAGKPRMTTACMTTSTTAWSPAAQNNSRTQPFLSTACKRPRPICTLKIIFHCTQARNLLVESRHKLEHAPSNPLLLLHFVELALSCWQARDVVDKLHLKSGIIGLLAELGEKAPDAGAGQMHHSRHIPTCIACIVACHRGGYSIHVKGLAPSKDRQVHELLFEDVVLFDFFMQATEGLQSDFVVGQVVGTKPTLQVSGHSLWSVASIGEQVGYQCDYQNKRLPPSPCEKCMSG